MSELTTQATTIPDAPRPTANNGSTSSTLSTLMSPWMVSSPSARLAAMNALPYILTTVHAAAWATDPDRTTYLVDIRTPEEYRAGHVPGSFSTDGARLVGGTFRTLAVRGARVVLIDDSTGARAAAVAHWLQRRGHEIALLLLDFDAQVGGAAVH